MNGQPHGASHGQPHGYSAPTVSAKTRHHTTPHRTAPDRNISRGRLFMHVVTLGNARRPFARIAEALMGWLCDDMDAATRRRFA